MSHKERWIQREPFSNLRRTKNVKETVWIRYFEGDGTYDRIGLHRLCKKDANKGVILFLPPTWGSGEQLMNYSYHGVNYSVPETETNHLHFLASRGYVVYAMDYRTHFSPPFMKGRQLEFMKEWTWEKWIHDVNDAVSFILSNESADMVYLAGESFGGVAAMKYASKHWSENLSGLLLLDGSPHREESVEWPNGKLPQNVNEMDSMGVYALETTGGPNNPIWSYALTNPDAPSPSPGYSNLSDFLMERLEFLKMTNTKSYPFSKAKYIFPFNAALDPYWPVRLAIEEVNDFKREDYASDYKEINLDCLSFISGRFGKGRWDLEILPKDSKKIILEGYGHLDVFTGEAMLNDVMTVYIKWLEERRVS